MKRLLAWACVIVLAATACPDVAQAQGMGGLKGYLVEGSQRADPGRVAAGKTADPQFIRLRRIGFEDRNGFGRGLLAFSVLTPEGWKTDGGLLWTSNATCILNPVSFYFTVTSPHGSVSIQFLPATLRMWADDPQSQQILRQQYYSAGVRGAASPLAEFCLPPGPPQDAETYFRTTLLPTHRGQTDDLRILAMTPLPEVEAAARERAFSLVDPADLTMIRQMGGDFRIAADAASFDAAYTRGGVEYRERFLVSIGTSQVITRDGFGGHLVQYGNQVDQLVVMRAPADRFDRYEPLFDTVVLSLRANREWLQRVVAAVNAMVRQQLESLMAIHRQNVRTRRAISEMIMDVSEQRSASMERMNEAFVRSTRGVERYRNPSTGEIWEAPYGHRRVWMDAQQNLVLEHPDRPLEPHEEPDANQFVELVRVPEGGR